MDAIYLCKKDLCKYSDEDLTILAKHRDINDTFDRDDLCWLLSIDIVNKAYTRNANMKGRKSPSLLQSMYKSRSPSPFSLPQSISLSPSPSPPPPAQLQAIQTFADKYNREEDCRWPTRLSGKPVVDCQFNIESERYIKLSGAQQKVVRIVTLPIGTTLYHGTKDNRTFTGAEGWGPLRHVWFASTFEHTMPLGPFKIHIFTTREPLILLYVQNVKQEYLYETGKLFMTNFLSTLAENIYNSTNEEVRIDGYIGCNECEIGLFQRALTKLNYPSIIKNPPYIE